jgi:TP901 family phage tail tape measure protein
MALNQLGLGMLFTARDAASATVVGLTKNVAGLEGRSKATASALQTGLGGVAAVAVGAGLSKLVNQAADFEFGLAAVKNIANATASDMVILRDAAFEAGLKTQFSPTQAVEGLQNLAAAGFSAAKSAQLLDRSLILAQAGQISVAQSTATMATAIKLFNLQGKDQETLVDKLLKTTSMFKIHSVDLEQGLAKTAAAALLTNQSVDEMLLTVGLIKNVFPDAGEAGNSVSRAMQSLSQKADKVKKDFGVDVLDANGAFKPALDLFLELDEASAKAFPNAAKRSEKLSRLLGSFGIKGFSAAVGSIDEFATSNNLTRKQAAAQLRGDIAGAEGTADQFLAGLNATFKGQSIILEGAVQTLAVALGEPLLKVLVPAVKRAAEFVADLARVVKDANPEFKQMIARIALTASAVLAFGGIVAILRVGLGLLLPALKAAAIGFAGTMLAAIPLIAVIGGVALVARAAAKSMDTSFGDAKAAVTGFFEDAVLAGKAFVQLMRTGEFSGSVKQELNRAENAGIKRFVIRLGMFAHRIEKFFEGVAGGINATMGRVQPALKRAGQSLMGLGKAMGFVSQKGDGVGDSLPGASFFEAGASIGRALASIFTGAVDVFGVVVDVAAGFISRMKGIFETFSSVFTGLFDNLTELGNEIGVTFMTVGRSVNGGAGPAVNVGKTIANAIGLVTIALVKAASIATKIATSLLQAFRPISYVVLPILRFVANHLTEIILILVGIKMARSLRNLSSLAEGFTAIKTAASGAAAASASFLRTQKKAQPGRDEFGRFLPKGAQAPGGARRDATGRFLPAGGVATAADKTEKALGKLAVAAEVLKVGFMGFALGTVLDQWLDISGQVSDMLTNRSGRGAGTAKGTKFDPTGRAANLRKFAKDIETDIQKSQKTIQSLAEAKVVLPQFRATAERAKTGQLQESDVGVLRKIGGFKEEEALITPDKLNAAQGEIRDALREAAAIEAAQRVAQSEDLAKGFEAIDLEAKFRDASIAANAVERDKLAAMLSREISQLTNRPITIQIDQETLAVAVSEGQRQDAARGFQAVGPGEG